MSGLREQVLDPVAGSASRKEVRRATRSRDSLRGVGGEKSGLGRFHERGKSSQPVRHSVWISRYGIREFCVKFRRPVAVSSA